MRITIAAPVRPGVASGNDVTAARWGRRLTELGHDVVLAPLTPDRGEGFHATHRDDVGGDADVLVVLHARRCARAVGASRAAAPGRPVVVGLAGTDLYDDLPHDADARAAVEAADALVVLQGKAIERLASIDPTLGHRAWVVHQSVEPPLPRRARDADRFTVAVLAHLREVKDPLLAARAARRLPGHSSAVVVHAGAAHDTRWAEAAESEMAHNPRYQWRGELPRADALALLAGADVLACTSLLEGGANVVSEAIALGVPVIGTIVDGTTGLLGDDHPGLVPVGDEAALAEVILGLERDPAAYAEVEHRTTAVRHLADPASERAAWRSVLEAIVPT